MRKIDEVSQPLSCLNKAVDDEPLFVLCGRDRCAPAAVEAWANNAEATGFHEAEKIAEAREAAGVMREWRASRYPPRVSESPAGYGIGTLSQEQQMRAFHLAEERKQYRRSTAMMLCSGLAAAWLRDADEGESVPAKKLARDAWSLASELTELAYADEA